MRERCRGRQSVQWRCDTWIGLLRSARPERSAVVLVLHNPARTPAAMTASCHDASVCTLCQGPEVPDLARGAFVPVGLVLRLGQGNPAANGAAHGKAVRGPCRWWNYYRFVTFTLPPS